MRKSVALLLLFAFTVSGCTIAKISGRGQLPLMLNNPPQKTTLVEHFSISKRRNFDYTGAFDVAEILGNELKNHPGADAVTNVTVTIGSDFGSFLIDLFTLLFANSSIFTVEGDLVKLGAPLGALPAGSRLDVADSTGTLMATISDFTGRPGASPVIVRTASGLAVMRAR
jgi:hypothetical protein